MYTKEQVLENDKIVIHCENEQEWEECKKEFPGITTHMYGARGSGYYNAIRPGGGVSSVEKNRIL